MDLLGVVQRFWGWDMHVQQSDASSFSFLSCSTWVSYRVWRRLPDNPVLLPVEPLDPGDVVLMLCNILLQFGGVEVENTAKMITASTGCLVLPHPAGNGRVDESSYVSPEDSLQSSIIASGIRVCKTPNPKP